ncbi:hypothetical protein EYF80_044168 [Liparis tanakae]|uniref:Uncharacterized protein n=1 Tax=Liparis tanakae TaxID=230148 RepID=A0A4Z2FZ47_9TELE|nr:hypothetical protein EYF80_044168 [Liparis tanakae]
MRPTRGDRSTLPSLPLEVGGRQLRSFAPAGRTAVLSTSCGTGLVVCDLVAPTSTVKARPSPELLAGRGRGLGLGVVRVHTAPTSGGRVTPGSRFTMADLLAMVRRKGTFTEERGGLACRREACGEDEKDGLRPHGAVLEQLHHLRVRQPLRVALVDLHHEVALAQARAALGLQHLLDPLARGAVRDGEAEALGALHHGQGQQLPLGGARRRHGDAVGRRGAGGAGGKRAVQVGVARVRGEQLLRGVLPGVGGVAGRARQVVQVVVVARAAVGHDGPLLHDAQRRDDGGGGVVGVGRLLRVEGQRVAAAQHQGHALADRHRLEQLDHVGVRGAQHAHVVDVDDDVTWTDGEHGGQSGSAEETRSFIPERTDGFL